MKAATFENINPKPKVTVTYSKRHRTSRAPVANRETTPESTGHHALPDDTLPFTSPNGLDLANIQNARLRRRPTAETAMDTQTPASPQSVLGKRNTSTSSVVQSYAFMSVVNKTKELPQSPSKRKRLPKEEKRDIYDYPEEEEEEYVSMEMDPMSPKLKLKTHKAIPAVISKPAPETDVPPKSFRAVTRINTSALPADTESSRILSKSLYSVASKSSDHEGEDVLLYDLQRVASKNLPSIMNGTGDATMRSIRTRQKPPINEDAPAIGLIEAGKPPPKSRRYRRNASSTSDPETDRTGIPSKMLKSPRPRPKPAFEPTDIRSSPKRTKSQRRIQTMVVKMSNGTNMSVDDAQLDASDSSSPGSSSTSGSRDLGRPGMPVFHKSFSDTSVPSPASLLSQAEPVLHPFHKSTLDDFASSSGKAVTESSVWYMLDSASSSSGAEAPHSAKKAATLPRRPNLVARMNQAAATAEKAEKSPRKFIPETHSGVSSLSASSSSHALPLSSLPEDPTIAPDSLVKTKPFPKRTFGRSVSSDVTENNSPAPPVSVRRWNSEQHPHAMALEGDAGRSLPPLPTSPGRQRYVPQNHGGVTVTYGRSRSFLGQGNGGGGEIGGGWFGVDDEWLGSSMRDEGLSDSEEEEATVSMTSGGHRC